MMTPQEVSGCTFTKAVMGGYNMASVDDFLDRLTEDYTALYKDNTALKAKIKVLVDKMEEYREIEDAMRSTLLTAQKMANNIVAEAEAKRDAMIVGAGEAGSRRLAEIEQEVAREEQRLLQVRADVDLQIAAEHARLEVARKELQEFIRKVQGICGEQLRLLERLPELPVLPEEAVPAAAAAPVQAAAQEPESAADPIPEPVPAPEPEPEPEPSVQEAAAGDIDTALERDLKDVFAALGREDELPVEMDEPFEDLADIFASDQPEEEEEDASATRVLNLDDLQFGRNYKTD